MNLEETKKFVYETLVRAFGEINIRRKDDGGIWTKHGSAIVDANIIESGRVYIVISAIVALNVPYSEELIKVVNKVNVGLAIGCFSWIENNGSVTVILKHTLIPEFVQKEELVNIFATIAETADDFDDVIVDKFGGEKMNEFIERITKESEQDKETLN